MEVPQWVWRWINGQTIEFIVFFKIMPNLGVFSTLYFWGGHKLLRLGTEAIHAVPDDWVYLRVYPTWGTLSWLYAVYAEAELDQKYLDVSGHIWAYLDISGDYGVQVCSMSSCVSRLVVPLSPAWADWYLVLLDLCLSTLKHHVLCSSAFYYILLCSAVFCSIIQLIYIELCSDFVCLRLLIQLLYMSPLLFNLAWWLKVLGSILLTYIRTL